jgi:fumarylacetoacetase
MRREETGLYETNATHDASRRSWVESANAPDTDFPIQNLPLGVFRRAGEAAGADCAGIAIGDKILDLAAALEVGLLSGAAAEAAKVAAQGPGLNALMALGNGAVSALRAAVSDLLRADVAEASRHAAMGPRILVPMVEAEMRLPAAIGAFTDFLTSVYHTARGGRLTRPDSPVPANFRHLPVAYNSRASTVRAGEEAVRRPNGQQCLADGSIVFGPCRNFDFELELGLFVGPGNEMGDPIPIGAAPDHIFGFCLVNDWSARDVQRWETHPLGPFLSKSAATSISPWVVTAEAMAPFRAPAFARELGDPVPLPYLHDPKDQAAGHLDLVMEAWIHTPRMRQEGTPPLRLTTTNFQHMYWTFAQMLTHHASNGCSLRPGDLIASGTVSGPTDESRACLSELSLQEGATERRPFPLGDGPETRLWLEDGDEVIFHARAMRPGFVPIGFGACRGRVAPAPVWPQ